MAVKYVEPLFGSDSNNGEINHPWQTISYGVSQLNPGDFLYLRGGLYSHALQVIDSQSFSVPSGASDANRITTAGYQSETVVIRPPDGLHAIRLTTGAPSYLSVRDLMLDGSLQSDNINGVEPLYCANGAHHCRFQRLDIGPAMVGTIQWSSNGAADLYSSFHELLDCVVHHAGNATGDSGHGGPGINNGYGIYNWTSDVLISGNEFHSGCAGAINSYGHRHRIQKNRIHGNGTRGGTTWGINIGSSPYTSDDVEIFNNLIYANDDIGVQVYTGSGNTQVYNNTITGNGGISVHLQFYASAPVIKNNILFGNGTDTPVDNGGTGTPVLSNNLTTDPLFTNSGASDFTLQAGSAAIDAGVTIASVADDFTGALRPAGAAYDIGAYESGATGGAGGVGESTGGGGSPGSSIPGEPPAGPGGGGTQSAPAGIVTDTYSDHDMQCPASWENGFKEGLITRWGDVERASSHLFTGEWQGSTFNFQIADKSNRFRAQAASFTERYWNDPLTVRMTTRANRALLGAAYTVFCGPIIDAQTDGMGTWDVTLGDVVSQGLLSDQSQLPWRVIRDGFLSQLAFISDGLDRDAPEPILYGRHTRAASDLSSPSSSEGLRTVPIYLGLQDVLGDLYHTWLVAGHAVEDLKIYVDDAEHFEFLSAWLIPHQPLFQTAFGAPYRDLVSDTYGNLRRYTLIYGKQGVTAPDDCALGDRTLTAAVWGIEDVGDGAGNLLTDRFQQYKHFLINFVANQGAQSYMTGPWMSNPTWDIFDGPVEKVDEDSFDTATTIGFARLIEGYLGAAAIGIQAGDRFSVKKWIADWNRSCACRFAISHTGQMYIFLLSPTTALKSVAPLYTDAYEILEDSFRTDLAWDEQANSIPYKADFNNATGEWITNGVETDATTVINYGRTITSETREYPFAPGDLQAQHLAQLELRIRRHRPHYIRLSGTIGPDPVTDESLAYREAGHYLRYIHFDAVSETYAERMAQIITPGIRVGPRIVTCVAMDCEDLIDYDLLSSP